MIVDRRRRCMSCEAQTFARGNGKCSLCIGSGVNVSITSSEPKCPKCGGTGVCPECHGTGILERTAIPASFGDWYIEEAEKNYKALGIDPEEDGSH